MINKQKDNMNMDQYDNKYTFNISNNCKFFINIYGNDI